MGVFEWDNFSNGTMAVMTAVANSKGFSVVGGGDSVGAKAWGMQKDIDHVSTGAKQAELMEKGTLPGLEILGFVDNQGGCG